MCSRSSSAGRFSNVVDTLLVKNVSLLQEFYADYFAIQHDLFSLNIPFTAKLFAAHWGAAEQCMYDRTVDGIIAVLLSFKWNPVIRFQGKSVLAKRVAEGVLVSCVKCLLLRNQV